MISKTYKAYNEIILMAIKQPEILAVICVNDSHRDKEIRKFLSYLDTLNTGIDIQYENFRFKFPNNSIIKFILNG